MLAVVFILTDTSEGWRRRRRMGSATRVPVSAVQPTGIHNALTLSVSRMKTTVLPQIFLMRSRPLGETLQATVPVMTKWTAKV
jgi:hypothetical protein